MKRSVLFLLFQLCLSAAIRAQDLKTFVESKPHGFVLYATNAEWYPVSVSLDLNLSNMNFSEGSKTVFMVPAKTVRFRIGELNAQQSGGAYKFDYKTRFTMGDVTIAGTDPSLTYDLPFGKGKSYLLYQGYNGQLSHRNENSLDFTMPESTPVLAAREGTVVQIVQNNTESCPREECKKYNNYVTVMHPDGTFASYVHIKFNGARCQLGQQVKKGELNALSGSVGYTTGPHLHFVCFLAGFDGWRTQQTLFRTGNGETPVILQEGKTYGRDY